jgi:hypothetical protein
MEKQGDASFIFYKENQNSDEERGEKIIEEVQEKIEHQRDV